MTFQLILGAFLACVAGILIGAIATIGFREWQRERWRPKVSGNPRIEIQIEVNISNGEVRLIVENAGNAVADALNITFPNLFSIANHPGTGDHARNIADGILSRALVFRRPHFDDGAREDIIIGYIPHDDNAVKQTMNLGLEYAAVWKVNDNAHLSQGIVQTVRYRRG